MDFWKQWLPAQQWWQESDICFRPVPAPPGHNDDHDHIVVMMIYVMGKNNNNMQLTLLQLRHSHQVIKELNAVNLKLAVVKSEQDGKLLL